MNDTGQSRVDVVWADAANLSDDNLVSQIDTLAAEREPGDPLALLERAEARDSAGREEVAAPRPRSPRSP